MPQKRQDQQELSQRLSAATIQESKAFRERLRDRYAPTDFVRVINIDDEPFEWQYFPSNGEDVTFAEGGTHRQVFGRQGFTPNYDGKVPGNEQIWELDAGESEVILGENADLFIEGLYKRLVVKKRVSDTPNLEKTQVRSFNWNDGLLQEQMIDKIFLGVERPSFDTTKRPATGRTEPKE